MANISVNDNFQSSFEPKSLDSKSGVINTLLAGLRQKHNQLGILCFTFSEKKSFSKIFHLCIKRLFDMSDI